MCAGRCGECPRPYNQAGCGPAAWGHTASEGAKCPSCRRKALHGTQLVQGRLPIDRSSTFGIVARSAPRNGAALQVRHRPRFELNFARHFEQAPVVDRRPANRTVECIGSIFAHHLLERRNAARMKGGELGQVVHVTCASEDSLPRVIFMIGQRPNDAYRR